MHLVEIQQTLYDRLGFNAATVNADVVRRLLGYINQTQREILGKKGFERMRRRTLPFYSTANSPYATLPQAMSVVYSMVDRDRQRPLYPIPLSDIRERNPGNIYTGNPQNYVVLDGNYSVAQDPSAASELFAKSSNAADTGQTVYVEGIIEGGYQRMANAVLNGTILKSLNTTITSWIITNKFYLSAPALGVVTLVQGSGGYELSRLAIGDTYAKYTRLLLDPIPTVGGTLYADGLLRMTDMSNPNDEPMMDSDFHWLLVSGSLLKEFQKREKHTSYAEEKGLYDEGVRGLRSFILSGGVRDESKGGGMSQLGPYFPADT